MDNLTHALVGLTVNNSLPERTRTTFWVSLLASELPDVDILYVLSGSSADYLLNHRGYSHSVSALFLTVRSRLLVGNIPTNSLP